MPQKPLPVVSDHLLHVPDREANERTPVVVGSERWYTWLAEEQNRSFSFRNALGTFTVRRERKRHGWYWHIYRKSGGKLRKAYLGKAEAARAEMSMADRFPVWASSMVPRISLPSSPTQICTTSEIYLPGARGLGFVVSSLNLISLPYLQPRDVSPPSFSHFAHTARPNSNLPRSIFS
jgi:hypothetical protein